MMYEYCQNFRLHKRIYVSWIKQVIIAIPTVDLVILKSESQP